MACHPIVFQGLVLFSVAQAEPALPVPPSFDCTKAEGVVETLVCADSLLAALDVDLAEVWSEVLDLSADNADLDRIRAEQRGWVKGRDDCWKSEDVRDCVETAYRTRIAELQARWGLVPRNGPHFFTCRGNPADEVVVTYCSTDPPTVLLERGDRTLVLFLQPAGSGARYVGGDTVFWTKGGEATFIGEFGGEEIPCRLRHSGQ